MRTSILVGFVFVIGSLLYGQDSRPAGRVRVLDLDEKPVAGAIVDLAEMVSQEMTGGIRVHPDYFTTTEPKTRVRVLALRTNENGDVEVPRFRFMARVRARSSDLAAEEWLTVKQVTSTYQLHLRRTLHVLVVDDAGKPQADVPVLLGELGIEPFGERGGSFYSGYRNYAVTGPDGIARLAPPNQRQLGSSDGLKVGIALPLSQPVTAAVKTGDANTEPIRLVLPPTGPLSIRLVTPDGTSYPGSARIRVKRRMKTIRDDYEDFGDQGILATEVTAAKGEVVLPRIGLGAEYVVRIDFADESLRSVVAAVAAVERHNEPLRRDIVVQGKALRITGRQISSQGKAREGGQVEAMILDGDPPQRDRISDPTHDLRIARTCVDNSARFTLRFEIDPSEVKTREVRFWPAWESARTGGAGGMFKGVDVRLPEVLPESGLVDIGDVEF